MLPELRTMWWETGLRARVDAGLFAAFAELPRLVARAVAFSWRADKVRTLIVAAGLRAPDDGVITWNGRPLDEYDPDALRARITVVTGRWSRPEATTS